MNEVSSRTDTSTTTQTVETDDGEGNTVEFKYLTIYSKITSFA